MTNLRWLLIIALTFGVAIAGGVGCDNQPPETAHRVIMEDDDDDAETEAPVEEEAAEPAESVADTVEETLETAEEVLEEVTEAVEEAVEEVTAEEQTFLIEPNPESFIQFTGYQALKSQEGFFNVFEGEITVEGDDLTTTQVNLTIDMDSLFTRTRMLTNVLKDEDFFHVTEYPEATFVSSRFEAGDGEDEYTMHGALTMRGVERRLGIPVIMRLDDAGLYLESELVIDRYNWGIEKDGYLDEAINEEVLINFEILAEPQS